MTYSLYLILLYIVLVAIKPTRRIAYALTPWLLFACSYDWMRLLPNWKVNPIDVQGIYETEKQLFGIATAAGTLIPSEWFAQHHNTLGDIIAGISYLSWVPVPLGFAIWLFFKGEHQWCLRFSWAFLLVNLVGFACYYVHPAAPPWYVMKHGFDVALNTPGDVGGLIRFDNLIGIPVFQSIYSGNSNVFAAVPSLHATYLMVATLYAWLTRQRPLTTGIFALLTVGIWFTAVYAGHHYVIDVLLGILLAIVTLTIYETAWRLILKIKTPHETAE